MSAYCEDFVLFVDESEVKEETNEEESYFEGEADLMDSEFLEDEGANGSDHKTPDYAIANVSCQYEGSPGNSLGGKYLFVRYLIIEKNNYCFQMKMARRTIRSLPFPPQTR